MLAFVTLGFALTAAAETTTPRLALDVDGKPLGMVLDEIHATTGFSITLTDAGWRAVPVSVHAPEAPIKETLRALFAGFNYAIVEQDDNGMTVAVSSAVVPWPEPESDVAIEAAAGAANPPAPAAVSSTSDEFVPPAHLLDSLHDAAPTQRVVNYDEVLNELRELERQNAFVPQ